MSKVEKHSVALTPQLAATVRAAVEAGDYASSSEAIREAIREWTERRELRAAKLADLRAAVQAGIDSGSPQPRRPLEEALADYRSQMQVRRGA
ncbi:MAG: type II toxin-antitoxin system ParD family antitoxin [Phenylobacterium sp.]|uniref:type II toxin-antitoxin system ParD family antitoxin n=1 Tax=Phenylobacterium sp. TaxID=1871053 RepID=UPI00273341AB|nr:type II toxin-antitoxin system ParD family antitoxin [Phenylobacterium sp.]MDP3745900.1 type II toxin-antitoxin system ParD family antitoxin [Phenylobacterium sp.]